MVVGAEPVVQARGIVKIFGQHRALDGVDFSVRPGEVHALLGENGAGKSTLIKILTGAYQPDGGEVILDGAAVRFSDPLDAQRHGIGTVYQEVNLLPNRSVAENLFLGNQPTRFGIVQRRVIEVRARELLAGYGLEIDVRAELGSYSVAVQQIVAIARAVELSGKVLVLDEPTASLDRNEVAKMFEVVARLKARGLGIIFITHFLDQVFEIADRVTILRNGKLIGTKALPEVTATDVVVEPNSSPAERSSPRSSRSWVRGLRTVRPTPKTSITWPAAPPTSLTPSGQRWLHSTARWPRLLLIARLSSSRST